MPGGASASAGTSAAQHLPARVLAVYAHPDDPDVSCGGTLARWSGSGCDVHVCICCDGGKGSLDPMADTSSLVAARRREAESAGRLLGVTAHHWLGYPDGELGEGTSLTEKLVRLVRVLRPDTVLAPDPTAVFFGPNYVNHRDHRAVGWSVLDVVSPAAGNPHYFPGADPPHQVSNLYLSGTLEPDTWVDITATLDVKAQALACHSSQLGEGGEWLRNVVREQAEEAGHLTGVAYAEAFRRMALA